MSESSSVAPVSAAAAGVPVQDPGALERDLAGLFVQALNLETKPEDIDQIMKLGCNFPMGPLRLADFIGLDVCHDIMMVLYRELGEAKFFPCPLLRQLVQAGRLGDKTGRGVFEYAKK